MLLFIGVLIVSIEKLYILGDSNAENGAKSENVSMINREENNNLNNNSIENNLLSENEIEDKLDYNNISNGIEK